MTVLIPHTPRKRRLRAVLVAPLFGAMALTLAGCASSADPYTISTQDLGSSNAIFEGTIVASTPITVRGNNTGVGATVGAVGGGLAGSQVGGRNSTQALGALGGAVAGGLLGGAIEAGSGRRRGFSYLIRGENGVVEEFPQLGEGTGIPVGTKVFVIDRPSGFVVIPEG
jgi:outer membrane lipoprotein SlyB